MSFSLDDLVTEQVNSRSQQIDLLQTNQILSLINEEDRQIAEIIHLAIPQITQAVEMVVDSFVQGGRLFYVGAGTSGRIGLLDALEMPPTFGTSRELVQYILAGGEQATSSPDETIEDNHDSGRSQIDVHLITPFDVVLGIAASGRTPFVIGAMERSRELGAKVIGLTNNSNTPMSGLANVVIEAVTGPEIILGSTRMKSGTAQKMILNMISTTAMIKLGKVYQNLMVDVKPDNKKLIHRAKRIIKIATQANDDAVESAFQEANGHVKTAIVMILAHVDSVHARRLLELNGGFVRKAIESNSS